MKNSFPKRNKYQSNGKGCNANGKFMDHDFKRSFSEICTYRRIYSTLIRTLKLTDSHALVGYWMFYIITPSKVKSGQIQTCGNANS